MTIYLNYQVDYLVEDDGVTVTIPDIPEVVSCGTDKIGAMYNVKNALETIIEDFVLSGKPIPLPTVSNHDSKDYVTVELSFGQTDDL